MLHQKETLVKDNQTIIQKQVLDIQNYNIKVNKLEKLLNNDQNAKSAYNTELVMDQNKLLKNRLDQMHKQSLQKDQEILHYNSR